MIKKLSKMLFILIGMSLVFLLTWCAENEPMAPEEQAEAIQTMLTAGPADGATLAFNSAVTFVWDGTISPGHITGFTYMYENTGTADTLFTTTDMQKAFSRSGLETGDYRFSVYATGASGEDTSVDASPVVINYSVGTADALVPVVTILQGPKADSYAATGSSAFFEWTATDPSIGGSIVSYQYALADSSVADTSLAWSVATLSTTQMSFFNLANTTYRFWVKATDVSGASGVEWTDFVVKDADVLFAIEPGLTAADITFWKTNALRDFAYEEYYVSDAASLVAKFNSGQYSSVVWIWKNDYSATLDSANFSDVTVAGTVAEAAYDFEQAGGHLWIMGSEVMWGLDDVGAIVSGGNAFATQVLHTSGYDEAGGNFQGVNGAGVGTYADIIVDGNATFTWCDELVPTADAEEISTFYIPADTLWHGRTAAIRYPIGLTNPGDTKVVFGGFYMTDSSQPAACKTADVYSFATTVLTDFGENED